MKTPPNIKLMQGDCMEYLATLPDNAFELAIVDPPYGIGSFGNRFKGNTKLNKWDKIPHKSYFDSLIRVSKNQIIWGYNYYSNLLPSCKGFVCWNKDNTVETFSSLELAYTSFKAHPKYFYYAWGGLSDGIKGRNKKQKNIHPTQKPVALYKWLLKNYAKEGDKILDTHLGSGSIALACFDMGFDLVGIELDKEYFEAAKNRFDNHARQMQLF